MSSNDTLGLPPTESDRLVSRKSRKQSHKNAILFGVMVFVSVALVMTVSFRVTASLPDAHHDHIKEQFLSYSKVAREPQQSINEHAIGRPDPLAEAHDSMHDLSEPHRQLPPYTPEYPQLDCRAFGGPDNAQEMVYWQHIEQDEKNHQESPATSYLTFEPDGGGFNNIRMAMETVIGLAIATNRILVMPPEQRMYLLGKNRGKAKTDFGVLDFFPPELHHGVHMITMQEFLETVALKGKLYDKYTHLVSFPPGNQTDWNGKDVKPLKEYLRNSTLTPLWSPSKCMAVFPQDASDDDADHLRTMHQEILAEGVLKDRVLKEPPPVDSSVKIRMRENLNRRKELCLYDSEMREAPVLHFMCYHKMRVRMLVHFYAFLFFESYEHDLWMKRFMRDHMRYKDEIQCAAGRIVEALRKRKAEFDTLHVRRGDFQYKATRIEATEIYENIRNEIPDGTLLYCDGRTQKGFL